MTDKECREKYSQMKFTRTELKKFKHTPLSVAYRERKFMVTMPDGSSYEDSTLADE